MNKYNKTDIFVNNNRVPKDVDNFYSWTYKIYPIGYTLHLQMTIVS